MRHIPVDSSNLQSVAYDEGLEILEITFKNGTTYQYQHVPYDVWLALMAVSKAGDSVGGWFAANIRKWPAIYPYKKIS